jgi:DNA-binding NarL/FixJ family response regulator
MAILTGDERALESAQLDVVLRRALRTMRALGGTGQDVAVVMPGTSACQHMTPGTLLVVLTPRATPLQASAALMIGARAYLPLDARPRHLAVALDRVTAGRLHMEPETASALDSLIGLTGESRVQPEVALALRLAGRGWPWPDVLHQLSLHPAAVSALLLKAVQSVGAQQRPSL